MPAPAPDLATQHPEYPETQDPDTQAVDDALTAAATLRRRAAAEPGVHDVELLQALVTCGRHLREAGRLPEAVAVTEECLALAWRTAPRMPGGAGDSMLALVLMDVGLTLTAVGRYDEALRVTEEGIARHRSSSDPAGPGDRILLGVLLTSRAELLTQQQRWPDALATCAEAGEVLAEVEEADPDTVQPLLASALYSFGHALTELGRPAEARMVIGEAVQVLERLVARQPGPWDDQLESYRRTHEALPTPDEVLDAWRAQVRSVRLQAEAEPGVHDADLAQAVFMVGVNAVARDLPAPALEAFAEAASLYEPLAAADPERHLMPLAASVGNRGGLLAAQGAHEQALPVTDRAVGLYRALAGLDLPASAVDEARQFLAEAQVVRAEILSALDRPEESVPALEEAADVVLDLARTDPEGHLGRWVEVTSILCDRLTDLGRDPEAEAVMSRCEDVLVELTGANPFAPAASVPQAG